MQHCRRPVNITFITSHLITTHNRHALALHSVISGLHYHQPRLTPLTHSAENSISTTIKLCRSQRRAEIALKIKGQVISPNIISFMLHVNTGTSISHPQFCSLCADRQRQTDRETDRQTSRRHEGNSCWTQHDWCTANNINRCPSRDVSSSSSSSLSYFILQNSITRSIGHQHYARTVSEWTKDNVVSFGLPYKYSYLLTSCRTCVELLCLPTCRADAPISAHMWENALCDDLQLYGYADHPLQLCRSWAFWWLDLFACAMANNSSVWQMLVSCTTCLPLT